MRRDNLNFYVNTSAFNDDSSLFLFVPAIDNLTRSIQVFVDPTHGKDTDHDVLIAGWDDDFPVENFSPKPSRNGAWLVKNSWGTMRGNEGGYFWMSYDQHTYGGTAFVVERANQRMRHYGYDDLGFCKSVSYSWGANIFRTGTRRENLKEAGFYAPSNNLGYELYVYDLGYAIPESPVSGTLASHTKGSVKFAGYYTITLPEAVSLKEGQYFSVVLKFSGGYMPVEAKLAKYSENAGGFCVPDAGKSDVIAKRSCRILRCRTQCCCFRFPLLFFRLWLGFL